MIKMKLGMYTEDEIFEYMTGGNGVRFLGRSMYDAIFDKIHALITENEQLKDIRETAINYIDQVIMYKPCAREIDEELNTLIGILRGGNNE